ncbi:hypothetical protein E2562_000541 [Oryza meyeriana var. granulata]|uniref:Uncharacterized protein n=1 Tax=Oryza meyeriana var. granulata TaxID=110450 RepID=A0A6G1DU05_9ORYZ|nr:hypothetical protein E2562_000541 [Oryza meyeriana var. granulata]
MSLLKDAEAPFLGALGLSKNLLCCLTKVGSNSAIEMAESGGGMCGGRGELLAGGETLVGPVELAEEDDDGLHQTVKEDGMLQSPDLRPFPTSVSSGVAAVAALTGVSVPRHILSLGHVLSRPSIPTSMSRSPSYCCSCRRRCSREGGGDGGPDREGGGGGTVGGLEGG